MKKLNWTQHVNIPERNDLRSNTNFIQKGRSDKNLFFLFGQLVPK